MIASRSTTGSDGMMKVRTASRSTGGVAMIERSFMPPSAMCSVRGIGVAVMVSTWTSARSCLSFSLWATPKCCSSSTMTRPRFLSWTPLPSSAWVPMTMSIWPSARPFLTSVASFAVTKRDSCATRIGRPSKRAANRRKCWRTSSVVGASSATCLPAIAATKAARKATSVLPKPTSPQISRSIGRPLAMSSSTAAIAESWSSVSS